MRLEELSADWTPPEGLGPGSMRPVQLSAAGWAIACVAVVFLAGAAVLAGFLWNQSQREQMTRDRLAREGVAAEGVITRLWHTGGESDSYRVSYQFETGGRLVNGRSDIPRNIWRRLKVSDPIPIRFVQADPTINHPVEWPTKVTPQWAVVVAPLSFVIAVPIFGFMLRKQWRLLSEGRAAPAMVVKTRRHKNQTITYYEFRLLSGAIQKGRSNSKRRLAEGELVTILYDPDNPRSSTIYPAQFVRVARM